MICGNVDKKSIDKGRVLGSSVCFSRDLGNHPANILTPTYLAKEAEKMGLVNSVVPVKNLKQEVIKWGKELLDKSPTALRFLKHAFNADTDHVYGIQNIAHGATSLYYNTEEAKEGKNAFLEKRNPDFSKYRNYPW